MAIVYDEADKPESTSALGGGTTPFMAPELLSPTMFGKSKCQVSKEADVYAFAMVVLQVCSSSEVSGGILKCRATYRC